MTGGEMPDSVIEIARSRAMGNPYAPDLWQLKHFVQYTDPTLQTPLGKLFISRKHNLIETDEVSPNSGMPLQDPFSRELISLLGEQILDTAYLSCGEGIDEVIETAKAELEQIEDPFEATKIVCKTVGLLVDSLRELDAEGLEREAMLKDEKGQQINHILKLSPMTVSLDNEKRFMPSCLSISIICASLLRKIGVDEVLHAGVLAQSGVYLAQASHTIAHEITTWADAHNVTTGDPLRQLLERIKRQSYRTAIDYDPHSTVLFKLKSRWTLFDPYADRVLYESQYMSECIDDTAEMVNSHKGLQVVGFYDSDVTELAMSEAITTVFEIIAENLPSKARWQKALDTAIVYNDWRVLMDVFTIVNNKINVGYAELLGVSSLFDNIVLARAETYGHDDSEFDSMLTEYTQKFLMKSLAQQVFGLKRVNDDELRSALARCDTDPSFYKNRVEDLYLWPFTAFVRGLQQLRRHHEGDFMEARHARYPHNTMEVGEVTHRVGFTSLLDVSYGLGYELPLSLWMSMSTSQLPYLYAKQTDSVGDREKVLADRLGYLVSKDLSRYRQLSVII